MTMTLGSFLDRIIDDGIAAAKQDYKGEKLDGAVAGFEACRGRTPDEILKLRADALAKQREAIVTEARKHWYWRCYEMEVEWVLNCLSAALSRPLADHLPTARGFLKTAEVLGFGGGVSA